MDKIERPWGKIWVLLRTNRFWVKVIHVKSGQRTSVQTHSHRSELHLGWGHFRYVKPHEVHYMLAGWYLELAWGWVDEEDIIRLSDKYGRK